MQQLSSGQKQPISNLLGTQQQFEIRIRFQAPFEMDYSCFGLNEQSKLQHDDYMTFFNQPQSPRNEVQYQKSANNESFKFNLNNVQTNSPQRYVICATIDHATAVMSQIQQGQIDVVDQHGQAVAVYGLKPQQFAAEKAVMLAEVYQKNGVWRIGTIGQGFNGGLKALVEHFGGDVAEETSPTVEPPKPVSNIDLRKKVVLDKVSHQAPQLIDLTKKSLISLEKKNLLGLKARVGLVLDRSGSMNNQYKHGDVQKIIDRVLPLAINFDDDGSFECWAFGKNTIRLDDVSMDNFKNYIETTHKGWKKWEVGPAINYEPAAIEQVIQYYAQFNDGIPTYIVFISDGGVHENRKITHLISEAAKRPIFWQFIGIGGYNYGILEKLDDMTGRVIDNCNFFSLDNITQLPDEQLYDLLLEEFPQWMSEAKRKGILN